MDRMEAKFKVEVGFERALTKYEGGWSEGMSQGSN